MTLKVSFVSHIKLSGNWNCWVKSKEQKIMQIINFSIMPSVLIGIIGTIIILTYKFYITTFQIN